MPKFCRGNGGLLALFGAHGGVMYMAWFYTRPSLRKSINTVDISDQSPIPAIVAILTARDYRHLVI